MECEQCGEWCGEEERHSSDLFEWEFRDTEDNRVGLLRDSGVQHSKLSSI